MNITTKIKTTEFQFENQLISLYAGFRFLLQKVNQIKVTPAKSKVCTRKLFGYSSQKCFNVGPSN